MAYVKVSVYHLFTVNRTMLRCTMFGTNGPDVVQITGCRDVQYHCVFLNKGMI
jgi:hypothetical protein